MTAAPVALVLTWDATTEQLETKLPELLLSVLRAHERLFESSKTVKLTVGLRENAEALKAFTESW